MANVLNPFLKGKAIIKKKIAIPYIMNENFLSDDYDDDDNNSKDNHDKDTKTMTTQ